MIKQIELQMRSFIFLKEILKRKINFKLRTLEFFIIYSRCQPMSAY